MCVCMSHLYISTMFWQNDIRVWFMSMTSYKCLFLNPPPDDVICLLCQDIVEEPYQLICCGQHICRKCVDKLKQQIPTPHCPMCRHNESTMFSDKYFECNTLTYCQYGVLKVWSEGFWLVFDEEDSNISVVNTMNISLIFDLVRI